MAEYSLRELTDAAGVSARTVRYYVAQGLLPGPSGSGPGARYGDGHLARLRVIRQLQARHLPLAEIRARLHSLSEPEIREIAESGPRRRVAESALEYVRSVLEEEGTPPAAPIRVPPPRFKTAGPPEPRAAFALRRDDGGRALLSRAEFEGSAEEAMPRGAAGFPAPMAPPPPTPAAASGFAARSPAAPGERSVPERSQWDRIALTPDVELHVRRPLGRLENRRVERLVSLARDLLKEDSE